MTMTSLTVSAAPGNSFQATRMQSTGATATGLVCLSLGLLLGKPYGRIPIECVNFNKRMLNVASHLHMPAQKLTQAHVLGYGGNVGPSPFSVSVMPSLFHDLLLSLDRSDLTGPPSPSPSPPSRSEGRPSGGPTATTAAGRWPDAPLPAPRDPGVMASRR